LEPSGLSAGLWRKELTLAAVNIFWFCKCL